MNYDLIRALLRIVNSENVNEALRTEARAQLVAIAEAA